ncbi:hypothetical protein AX769_04570 [Frondihabitans sp. PAMC 28766]|uniref:DUF4232 domain-containing protein n=1 Tax=Frondihabitans sp. PAMC 28766 TaxID=1795630 RepID=UPI00078D4F40|nr:DUF4232 domain-containing protein [Frondihabitans sp. PAMC 28766]AMM19547.1 hypothetical protein AX769_04570 [Frondihabitans sp. PAMC 28766]
MRTTTRITIAAVALLTAVGLAGCSGGKSSSEPTATQTVTTTPSPSDSATPSSTPTAPSTTGTGTGSGSGTGSGTGTGTGTVAACTTANLRGSLDNANGGAAGSTYASVVLTNVGTASCTLQGWPGVSLVGDSNGTQIGAAAVFDRTSPHGTVTLAPKAAAKAPLRIVQALNYDNATCSPTTADGFRVYPPGQKASLFVQDSGVHACKAPGVKLLTVSAFQ